MDAMIKPICTFQGGKGRLAKAIVDEILNRVIVNDDTVFYDMCCGSGAISIELVNRGVSPNRITMLDNSEWGAFWNMIGNNKFSIKEFEYHINKIPKETKLIHGYISDLAERNVYDIYTYIILQAAAFGGKQIWWENGKWNNASFRSYWLPTKTSNRKSPVNPMMPMPFTMLERAKSIVSLMAGVNGKRTDVSCFVKNESINESNCVIYIDPPYKKTEKYGYSLDIDNTLSSLFYSTLSPIFVSEGYAISDEFVEISSGRKKGGISGNRKSSNSEVLNIFK